MSSAPTISPAPTGPTPPAPAAASSSSTFWCHDCYLSISLPSSATAAGPTCPHCHTLSLELLDNPASASASAPAPVPLDSSSSSSSEEGSDFDLDSEEEEHPPNPNPNPPNPNPNHNPPNPNPNHNPPNPNPNPTAYLQLLIQHLAGDDSLAPSDLHIPRPRRGPSPAPKSSIDSIPSITISDPLLLCAICKDEFLIDSEARKLPCSHIYHSDCIVPWLSSHNSCPLCRCQLPPPDGSAAEEEGRRVPSSLVFGGRIVRGIARRQRMMVLERRRREGEGVGVTETQMAWVEGNAGPANSGETVSSAWPAEGGDPAVVSGVREGMGE